MDKDVSLAELRTEWTFDDIMKANAVLDMKLEQQMAWDEYSHSKNKPGGSK